MAYATVTEFNTYIRDDNPDTSDAAIAQKQEWLDAASADIDAYLGYSIEENDYVESLSGYGLNHIGLSAKPITVVTSVTIDDVAVSLDEITIEGSFIIYTEIFPRGNRNVHVEYTAGYAEIPAPIKLVCKTLADLYRVAAQSTGVSSVSDPRFGSRTYSQTDQKRALRGIDQYRLLRL
jgi:hypothetical protein